MKGHSLHGIERGTDRRVEAVLGDRRSGSIICTSPGQAVEMVCLPSHPGEVEVSFVFSACDLKGNRVETPRFPAQTIAPASKEATLWGSASQNKHCICIAEHSGGGCQPCRTSRRSDTFPEHHISTARTPFHTFQLLEQVKRPSHFDTRTSPSPGVMSRYQKR